VGLIREVSVVILLNIAARACGRVERCKLSAMRWLVVAACAATFAAFGCNYTSDYRPPRDGRARPIYQDDTVVVATPALPFECGPYGPGRPVPGARYVPAQVVLQAASRGSYGGGGVYLSGPIFVPGPHLHGSSGSVSSGGGSGDGGKLVAVALAVAAIVAFPFIIVGLAAGNPEQEDAVASAIDSVNQYNDQLREQAAVCAELADRRSGP
jgi:hypothetical protein